MRIEIAPHERMSESGSSLMRLIQNNELPTLDLLIRESIQNSSDASLRDVEAVNVSFNINSFDPHRVNHHFEGITSRLDEKYNNDAQYLEIRDTNTTGLTGPLHHSEVIDNKFGNLINLVYEISKPQQREGAGGSWGLGKTIYFRVGIGLVVYYSRIINAEGEYESRLVACLVEDERKPDTLLPPGKNGPKRGIAWWGTTKSETQTIPITDENEINTFLNDINVTPFDYDETGTAIIIPYINEEKLMHSARAIHEQQEQKKYWWLNSVEDYLKVCIQRWYAPRINNKGYKWEKRINASVNGKVLIPNDLLPTFKVIQDLYNNSDYSNKVENIILNKNQIYKEKVYLRGLFQDSGEAGQLIFTKLSKEDLLMTPPNNHDTPYIQANVDYSTSDYSNPPLLCYLRKPGMIVNYDSVGSWVSNINPPSDDEFLIGLFIPNSKNKLNFEYDSFSLEEYLRQGEKADHTSWNDWVINEKNPLIVSKIKGQISRKINQKFTEKDQKKYETKKTSIGKSLANILLPPENFGKEPTNNNNNGKGGVPSNTNNAKKSTLELLDNPIYESGQIQIPFKLKMGKLVKNTLLELRVNSESGSITAETWENANQIGMAFPLEIKKLYLDDITINKENESLNKVFEINEGPLKLPYFEIDEIKSSVYKICYGVKVSKIIEESLMISGKVSFKSEQGSIKGSLSTVDKVGEIK